MYNLDEILKRKMENRPKRSTQEIVTMIHLFPFSTTFNVTVQNVPDAFFIILCFILPYLYTFSL